MAEFDTYPLDDLVNVEKTKYCPEQIVPGSMVHHKEDANSFGTVMSRRWGDKPGDRMQCEVLWSKQPKIIKLNVQSVPIQAKSRKLNARWTAEEAEPLYDSTFNSTFKVSPGPQYTVEEEYENLSYDEVRKFHEDGADIQLHSDGRATVKRRTNEIPREEYERERIRRRSISFRR